ncbi:MAG: hypothetical protein ABIS18_02865 [Actinomycetota bacterium]
MGPVLFGVFGFLVLASVLVTFRVMGRASKGYAKAKERRIERGPVIACSTCESSMGFAGLQEFNLGAGPLATALEVYRCPTCRKVEFFLPPAAE